jgi:hypothetical protein
VTKSAPEQVVLQNVNAVTARALLLPADETSASQTHLTISSDSHGPSVGLGNTQSQPSFPYPLVGEYLPLEPAVNISIDIAPQVVGGISIGGALLPDQSTKRRNGQRSCDKTKRKSRTCKNCVANYGPHFETCQGRAPRGRCEYFPILALWVSDSSQ